MKLSKIHRGTKFFESDWLKSYIDLNTQLRANAKSDFEKDFFKLMKNSVFGQKMENIRNRVDVRLNDKNAAKKKLASKPNLEKNPTIFNKNLVANHMKKTSLVFNKPVYLVIIQHIVTLPKYGHGELSICRPHMTDILRYT